MWLVVMRFVDLMWLIGPAFGHDGHAASISWLHPAAFAAVGGLFLWYFIRQLQDRPLLPINDPYLEEALEHAAH